MNIHIQVAVNRDRRGSSKSGPARRRAAGRPCKAHNAGNVTVTLPDASDVTADTVFVIKRTTAGANTLTVAPGSGNIDGSATYSLPNQYDRVAVVSDGANYWII
jgi:hypothetical protein